MSALDVHIFWRSDVEKAAAFTGFSEDQIVGRVRTPELCETRFAIWLSMRSRGLSLPAIGHHFKRDHATKALQPSKPAEQPQNSLRMSDFDGSHEDDADDDKEVF